jgi:hypothetical protein
LGEVIQESNKRISRMVNHGAAKIAELDPELGD